MSKVLQTLCLYAKAVSVRVFYFPANRRCLGFPLSHHRTAPRFARKVLESVAAGILLCGCEYRRQFAHLLVAHHSDNFSDIRRFQYYFEA